MYLIILSFIALGTLLVWYLLRHDHGRKLPVGSLWLAFGFGLLATVLATFLELKLFPRTFWTAPQTMPVYQNLLFFLGIGFLEEAVKFLPLALFIFRRPYFKEHTDGVIYFAICGMTFGLLENIMYTMSFGSHVGISRLILTPFFHAASTSILGYYLVSWKINHAGRYKFALACGVVPLMHGLYDFGLYSGNPELVVLSLMITLLFAMGLFLYFMQANDLDKAALATVRIPAANFCRFCGRPNYKHKPYCESCGHQL